MAGCNFDSSWSTVICLHMYFLHTCHCIMSSSFARYLKTCLVFFVQALYQALQLDQAHFNKYLSERCYSRIMILDTGTAAASKNAERE